MSLDDRLARDAERWRRDDRSPSFDDALDAATTARRARTPWLAVACGIVLVATVVAMITVFAARSRSGGPDPSVRGPAVPVQLPSPSSVTRDGHTYYAQVVPTFGVVTDGNTSQLLAYHFDMYDKNGRTWCNFFDSGARVVSQTARTVTVATYTYADRSRQGVRCGFFALSAGDTRAFVLKLAAPLGGRRVIDAYTGAAIGVFPRGATPPKPAYLPPGLRQTGVETAGSSDVSGATSTRTYMGPNGTEIDISLGSVYPEFDDGTVVDHVDVNGHAGLIVLDRETKQRCVRWTMPTARLLTVCTYATNKGAVSNPELLKIARSLKP